MMPPLDDRSLSDIIADDLRLYLLANHWIEQEVVNDLLAIWTRPGLERELFVPRRTDALDYETQLSIIVRYMADIENRQPRQVLSDMRHTGADVIRVRIDTPVFDRGTIAFGKAAEVINETRSMLNAAARAAVHPQSFFTSRPPAEVSDYLETTRLGQTEPGSFIFTVISPLTFQPQTQPEQPPPQPFARRVTTTLSKSLVAVRNAAKASDKSLASVFEDLVDDGVSANLCEALFIISEQSFDRAVDVDFTWSAKAPHPYAMPRTHVVVPPMITPELHNMSNHLKAVAPEPAFEIIGKVERLSNQEASDGFDLALRANVQGRDRLLALELSDDAREIASTAWKTGRSVFTRGTLDRRYRPYRLLQPDRFELIDVQE